MGLSLLLMLELHINLNTGQTYLVNPVLQRSLPYREQRERFRSLPPTGSFATNLNLVKNGLDAQQKLHIFSSYFLWKPGILWT